MNKEIYFNTFRVLQFFSKYIWLITDIYFIELQMVMNYDY